MKKTFYSACCTFSAFLFFLLISIPQAQGQNLIISGGNDFSMAVCDDGKIKTWGNVLTGPGQKQIITKPTDVLIPSDLKFSQADAGSGYHVVALDCQNRVWAFGENGSGQLGRTPSSGSAVPVPVPGVGGQGQLSGAQYVTGANRASFAILADGRVVSWGENGDGQLGRGNTNDDFIPNYVLKAANTPLTNIFQVDAGDETVYALDGDGYVWACGDNQNGALGRSGGSSSFAQYVLKSDGSPLNNIIMISGGDRHGLALAIDGTVWSWGGNWGHGQLGNGDPNNNDQLFAAQVVGVGGTGILRNATYIAAGQASSMVVLRDGRVVTFGSNALFLAGGAKASVGGNLGQGTTVAGFESLTPNYVVDCSGNQLSNILYISDADAVTYAMTRNGDVYVMGGNTSGELGLENTVRVGCATKLDLAVKYSCGLPDQCPDPNLGPDIPVCNTADLTNITLSTAGYRTYTYKWYYRTNASTSFTQLSVADTNILKPTRLGQYMVEVERASNNCTTCKPGYDTITVDQTGIVNTFCKLTNNVLSFSVTGNGIYKWYKSATGNDSLPTRGSTQNISINALVPEVSGDDSTYNLYVEDMKVYSGTFVSPNLGSNPYQDLDRNQLLFNVYNTLTIHAASVLLINYGNESTTTVSVQVLAPNGTQVGLFTSTFTVPSGRPVATPFRVPFGNGLTLNPGTGYTIKFTSSNGQIYQALYNPSTVTYPITSTGEIANRIAITGVGVVNSERAYPGFVNWEITSTGGGFPCGRLKVSLTRYCPCNAPKINLVSSTNALTFCDNGAPSTMALSVTANPTPPLIEPFSYVYQWYKNGGLITPGGNQNTLTINSTDGLAAYSVRVGHSSVLRTRCYTDTSFTITKQPIIANNVITGNDTVCPGFSPKQKMGVGTVTGGVGTPTYQWVSSLSGNAPWTNVAANGNSVNYSPTDINITTFYRRVVTSNGVCPADTSNTVVSYASPAISPGTLTSNAGTICENTSVTISSTPASGGVSPYRYRWESSVNSGPFTPIAGETGENLVNSNFVLTNTTQFRRIVSSAAGGCDAAANITIGVDRNSTGNTLDGPLEQTICEGQLAQTIVGATPGNNGKSPTYQWLSSPSNSGPFSIISGAVDKDLSAGGVLKTTYYKRVVTSTGVCKTDSSVATAKVLVDSTVTPGSIIPAQPIVCFGTSPVINKGISPTGGTPTVFSYLWEYSIDGTSWTTITGFNGEGPLFVAPSIAANAQYRRTVQSLKCTATTDAVLVTVTGEMSPGTIQSTDVNICPGRIAGPIQNVTPASGGTGNNILYQWQTSPDGNVYTDLTTDATWDSYTPTTPLTVDTYFRRRATNGNGKCDTVYTDAVKITQYQPQNPGAIIGGDTTVCIGSNITAIQTVAPSLGSPTKLFSWVISYEPYTSWSDTLVNLASLTIPSIQKSMKFKRVVKDECSLDTSANVYTVNVLRKTIPDINFVTDMSKVYCNNTSLQVTVSTKNAGLARRIEWIYNTSSRISIPDSILTLNAGELINGAKIKVVVTSDPTLFCTETITESAEMTVNVDSRIIDNTITSAPQSLCYSEMLDSVRASSSLGTLGGPAYGWQSSSDNNNWQNIAGANFQNIFPYKVVGDTYYRRITFSAGACPNDTTTGLRVFVDSLVDSGRIQPLSAFQCQGDSVVINSATVGTGGTGVIHYTWDYSVDGKTWYSVPGAKDSAGLFIPDKVVLDNTKTIIKFYFRRNAISGGNECSSYADTVGVTVCQDPIIRNNLYQNSVCAGSTISDSVITRGDYSPNGGNLVVDSVRSVKGASVSVSRNIYTYIPLSPTFVGRDTVVFTIRDEFTQRSKKKYLYIMYYPVNHPPVVVGEVLSTYRNQAIIGANIITGTDSDPDGDTLYVNLNSFTKLPKFGQIQTDSTGELSYEPQRDLALRETVYDTAIYTVCDYSKKRYCNEFFCKQDTVIFEIKPYRIFVPEGFSPNGDGVNDYFVIRSEVPLEIEIKVYNRWGNLVYENKNYKNDWNGNANRGLVIGDGLPDGTYYLHYNVNDKLIEPGFMYITISR